MSATATKISASGELRESVALPERIFDVEPNVPLMHQVVVAQQAAARQGTHATRTRGQVRGGGKKPYRQKGTGRARQGSTRAPQFAGGGVVHGPQPRDYRQRTPKKMKVAALRGALSARAREDSIHILDDLGLVETPSTKSALRALRAACGADADHANILVALHRAQKTEWLSLRNLPNVHVVAVDQLNTLDVLWSDQVVFTDASYEKFIEFDEITSATGGTLGAPRHAFPSGLLETGNTTSGPDSGGTLTKAHDMAKSAQGITSHRSDDPAIDGWSVASDDVEYVAFERHDDHVLVTWPTTMSAADAIAYFRALGESVTAIYADGEGYVETQEPGSFDWTDLDGIGRLTFLRVDLGGGEVLMWEVPIDLDLNDNRFIAVEPHIQSEQLFALMQETSDRDIAALLHRFIDDEDLDLVPLNPAD